MFAAIDPTMRETMTDHGVHVEHGKSATSSRDAVSDLSK